MHIAFHHYQKNKKSADTLTTGQKKLNRVIDDLIYGIGSFGVLIFVPQLIKVWGGGDISGVSPLTWVGMLASSIFWLTYGIIHKARPIIFINSLAAIIQFLVVFGLLIHR